MASKNQTRSNRQQRAAQMTKERERADAKRRNLITLAIVVVVAALIGFGAFAINSAKDKTIRPLVAPVGLTSEGGILYTQMDATGTTTNKNPVEVVLYEDFQCPICKVFEQRNGAFLKEQVNSGAISIEYRPVSFLDRASSTDYSSRALNAAMCVYTDKGTATFQEFHGLLFANQPKENTAGQPDSRLAKLAEQAGATNSSSCVTGLTYKTWAQGTKNKIFAMKDALGAPIDGTPTVWVDGRTVSGPITDGSASIARVEDLRAAIASASSK